MTTRTISSSIFRAYDIRGIVGQGLDSGSVRLIGQAIGSELRQCGEDTFYVGRDCRLSSPELGTALIAGILDSGCNAVNLGEVPTPLLYFAACSGEYRSGVMLTGSHNPGEYNGIKIVLNRQTLAANQISRLYERIIDGELSSGRGRETRFDIKPGYLSYLAADLKFSRRFNIVLDCGNGVTGLLAPELFTMLGCRTRTLYGEPDGRFPNHHPDPTREENLRDLQAALHEGKHDLGIAFDGDGDRVILLTGTGQVIDADRILMLLARDLLKQEPGATVVFDVKSSHHLPRLIRDCGGKPVMCRSGHSFVKQALSENGALLGGEYSAHIFYRHRWFGFDDGLYTAARFLELLDKYGRSADELLAELPQSFSTPELFIPVAEEHKFALMQTLSESLSFPGAHLNHLDGIRADFEHGWGLVRASNTTPNLVLRFEADSEAELAAIRTLFLQAIQHAVPTLSLGALDAGASQRPATSSQ